MALQLDSWAVAGAQSSARIARLQLQSGTRSGNGIVESGDLLVRELAVPGTSVRVSSGAAVILGKEAAFQGSYYAHNIGDATVPISATGSGGGRTDMVVLQVEDPGIDGTPWTHDPAVDPVYYFRVIEGVSSTATEPPSGLTAIPLARITIPASTSTITNSMITDLRQMLNPRIHTEVRVQKGQGLADGRFDEADFTSDYERWPQHDWTVTIPSWATQVQVQANWSNVMYPQPGGTTAVYDARGLVRVGLIGTGGNTLYTMSSAYNFNPTSATNGYRCSIGLAAQANIPTAMRGMTCDLRMYAKADVDMLNHLVADGWANFDVTLTFRELATPGATL
ncbi:hypothetical protein ACOQFV_09095 [Nocardiopsis changdeensis]|uniref:Minor tail protein n=1 Tax=Nocardiopsis changdeensis TaxID=2831969 RepID=A0ABX8BH04_9ACTN|nr:MULTISPECIES: hypothetical protein [Nocardiopsis]QUX20302.1 hypothetical protein KGD84_17385 [Nocardiopsis changdeensis]QYX36232.1 hypothetical protein K1J57_26840 [Nocardiopsis sp. MT53]